jgi:CRP-like cAMP-binding protein
LSPSKNGAAGQRNLGLATILRGELQVFGSNDGHELILATPGPGDFLGNVAMLIDLIQL